MTKHLKRYRDPNYLIRTGKCAIDAAWSCTSKEDDAYL